MRITFISDTHNKHKQITQDLPGGDLLIHAGDISSMGHKHEIQSFCKWYDSIDNYDVKLFIAGNHDWGFQSKPDESMEIVNSYKWIDYLQDSDLIFNDVKIYGSPWQPEFHNWAFNLPRNGDVLQSKWDNIPNDTDILITHGPAWGVLDDVEGRRGTQLGCELLTKKTQEIKPKIHVCGHIHTGRGLVEINGVLYINAAVLNERYTYQFKPITIDYDFNTKEWEVITY